MNQLDSKNERKLVHCRKLLGVLRDRRATWWTLGELSSLLNMIQYIDTLRDISEWNHIADQEYHGIIRIYNQTMIATEVAVIE